MSFRRHPLETPTITRGATVPDKPVSPVWGFFWALATCAPRQNRGVGGRPFVAHPPLPPPHLKFVVSRESERGCDNARPPLTSPTFPSLRPPRGQVIPPQCLSSTASPIFSPSAMMPSLLTQTLA